MTGNDKNRRGGGFLLHAVDRFSAWLYCLLASGLFGRFFTSYDRLERAALNGFGGGFRRRLAVLGRVMGTFRRRIAAAFESSHVLKGLRLVRGKMLECSLSIYGVFCAVYGCYTLVFYFVFRGGADPDIGFLLSGGIFLLIAIPLLFSGRSLSEALLHSRIMHWLLIGICGISEDDMKIPPKTSGPRYVVAISMAVIGGCLTYYVHPLAIPGIILLISLSAMVFFQPEMGAVLTLFACPFLSFTTHPTIYLACLIGVTGVGYLCKLVCGRRVFHFGLLEGAVGFFMILVLFGGIVTAGGTRSLYSAFMYVLLIFGGFFLVSNLARTRVWLRRCSIALFASCTIVSLIGVGQHFFADLDSRWLDQTLFSGIAGRVTSVFANPNMLAVFLVLVLPVALGFVLVQKRAIKGFFLTLCGLSIVFCVILTWSRGAWLGALVAVLLMLLLHSHKTLTAILVGILPVCVGGEYLLAQFSGFSLFDNIVNRFSSIGNLADSSTLYRVYTWRGVGDMIHDRLIGGIGVGEGAFTEVYPLYALPGIEAVMHSHSLYLQVLGELGIVGLIVLLVCMFLFVQKCLGFLAGTPDKRMRIMVIAGLCGTVGALIMGLADYIWYNYSICFLFWALIGLTVAYVRVGLEEQERAYLPTENSPLEAEVTLEF